MKDSELKNILKEVEDTFAKMVSDEQAKLSKAVGDDEGVDEGGGAEASAGPAPEASAEEAGAPEGAPVEASAGGAPAPEASAPGPEAAPADPAADVGGPGQVPDLEALKAEYVKVGQADPEALKAHFMAAKAAVFELMGGDQGAGPDAGAPAPDAGAGGPPPEASAAAAPPPALKAEVPASMKKVPANGGLKEQAPAVPDAIKKSLSEKDAQIGDLSKQVELLTKAVELSISGGQPQRKAVTGLDYLKKSENEPKKAATPESIKAAISKAVRGGKLTKSQRDSLFSYTLGNTTFDEIKGLLDLQ